MQVKKFILTTAALASLCLVSACTQKTNPSSTGPSYTKRVKNISTKSVHDSVLYVHHGKEKIFGHVFTSTASIKRRPIAIVSHGLGGNYQELESYAKDLAKKGYLTYAFDFPGGSSNGRSTGLPQTKMSIYSEEQDLLAVISNLRKRKDVNKNNILLVGGSQGAVVSALTASNYPEHIKGLALMYPAFSITHDAQAQYHTVSQIPKETDVFGFAVGKTYYQGLLDVDITKTATKYKGPVLIVHGTADDIVPIKYVTQAANNFSNVEFKRLSGAGHGFEGSNQQEALKFLNSYVKRTQNSN